MSGTSVAREHETVGALAGGTCCCVRGTSVAELGRRTGKEERFFLKFLSQLGDADIKALGGRTLPVG